MAEPLKTYSADQVVVTFGPILMSGLGEDDAVSVEFDAELYTGKTGVDGSHARARTNNGTAKVTVKLLQTARANAQLTAHMLLDQAGNGVGGLPLLIKNLTGNTLYADPEAYLSKRPDPTFGREVGEREWVFTCPKLTGGEGGN